MLSCVTDQEQISNNPSNNSLSKQLFSFPKGPRFGHYTKGYNPNVAYNAPSEFQKQKVYGETKGFGVARPELFP